MSWRESADRVLAPLFADGKEPTKQQIHDAYPFRERAMWPYRVWLKQVRLWKHAHRMGMANPYSLKGVKLDGHIPGLTGARLDLP